MARIRTIKPEFWRHEDLSALPEATHMLAAQLLNYADDFGYFNANPALIKAEVSPLREPSVIIPESLRSLQTIGYLVLGMGPGGRHYGRVTNFEYHQRVSHATPSKISGLSITWEDIRNSPEILRNPPEDFRPEQGTGNREQGKEIADPKVIDLPSSENKEISDAIKLYNDMAQAMGLAAAVKITPQRRSAVRQRIRDAGGLAGWRSALVKLSKTPFCCGENERGWRADLDWLCKPKSFLKLVEGGYDHSPNAPKLKSGSSPI